MAYTRFVDIPNFSAGAVANAASAITLLDPTFYNDDILNSSIVARSARFDALASVGSQKITVPFLNPLDAEVEENVASPDESIMAGVNGMSGGTQDAITHFRDQSWASGRMIPTLKGVDPMMEVARKVERYKIERRKKHLATNLTAIAITAGSPYTADGLTEVLNSKLILKGLQTFGDAKGKVKTAVMHSIQHFYLQEAALGYKPASETDTGFAQIHGINIVVTDTMPVTLVALVADDAFAYGAADLGDQTLELAAIPRGSRGWGNDEITARWQYILHPMGFNFVGAVDASNASPTNAEMANGNDWALAVSNRKAVPFGFIKVAATPA